MSQEGKKSIFATLWEHRVPQFFATYLGVCWAILQFLNFICDRYSLNGSIVDKFLIFVAILIPGVLLYIYNHGKPGPDPWTKLEKVILPGNLVLAGVLAIFLGGSNSAKASAPIEVVIADENGEEVTRLVPSTNQSKDLYFFPFTSNVPDYEYLRTGMPILLGADMEQDMRITTRNPLGSQYQLGAHDYEYRDEIPFSVMLDIAKKSKYDYFLTGNIQMEEGQWSLELKAFESQNGDEFFSELITAEDIYSLADKATATFTSNLFLIDNNSDFGSYTDLPASNLISSNEEAFKLYSTAIEKLYVTDEYDEGIALTQQAISLDDKSAELKFLAADVIRLRGDMETSKKLISEALSLSKQLPERQQFNIKKTYWTFNKHIEKSVALMNNWTTLYPRD